jgi:hypothetical protein
MTIKVVQIPRLRAPNRRPISQPSEFRPMKAHAARTPFCALKSSPAAKLFQVSLSDKPDQFNLCFNARKPVRDRSIPGAARFHI